MCAGTLRLSGKRGANRDVFTGRLAGGRSLTAGTYVVTFAVAGQTGLARRLTFTIAG
jgi:hypothetical protein